jgi:riboflavin kinase
MATPFATVTHVILDLDGTLINTEQLVDEVVSAVLHKRGDFTPSRVRKAMEQVRGMRPGDGTRAVMDILGIRNVSVDEMLGETSALLDARWGEVCMMPGARRLLDHLHAHGVKTALATSTPKAFLKKKMASHDGWVDRLTAVATGDEVENGKPAPDIFALAMKRLGVLDPKTCVVLEDTPVGVRAAKAAGAFAIAIPSIHDDFQSYKDAGADETIRSLYDLEPTKWGLPPFTDRVDVTPVSSAVSSTVDTAPEQTGVSGTQKLESVLPLAPVVRLGGPVVRGFGRGSKTLGIPTANLDVALIKKESDLLAPGIYFGWAGLRGDLSSDDKKPRKEDVVVPMVMSIGWNPFFENQRKTVEPWLLKDFGDDGDFYGRELRLAVLGYIRPEANFVSLESLIERIHKDADVARGALAMDSFEGGKNDPYLRFES